MHPPPQPPPQLHHGPTVYVVGPIFDPRDTQPGLWLDLSLAATDIEAEMELCGVNPNFATVVDQLGMGPAMVDEHANVAELIEVAATHGRQSRTVR